jgi:hypothetical protein
MDNTSTWGIEIAHIYRIGRRRCRKSSPLEMIFRLIDLANRDAVSVMIVIILHLGLKHLLAM